MNHVQEALAGYDAREVWVEFDADWDQSRKDTYLYRTDLVKPLSIDPQVWPSVFDLLGDGLPSNQFGYQTLWADLKSLRNAVSSVFKSGQVKPFRMIAVTLMLGDYCIQDEVDWNSMIPTPDPEKRADDWLFVGFDVGDAYMLSALANCGFLAELDDVEALRNRWGPHLNKYHLFDDLRPAIEFKKMSDTRLQGDHAPCFVFGIWLVKAIADHQGENFAGVA